MVSAEQCISQCRAWVEQFIQARSICPFAAKVIATGVLSYRCLESADNHDVLTELITMIQSMQTTNEPETTLVILPAWQDDFDDFLILTDIARSLISEYALEADYQLANFHPDYLFDNEARASASHFTNRSPWPMIHILRQASISEALEHYPDPETIPARNITKMQSIGAPALQQQLSAFQNLEHK